MFFDNGSSDVLYIMLYCKQCHENISANVQLVQRNYGINTHCRKEHECCAVGKRKMSQHTVPGRPGRIQRQRHGCLSYYKRVAGSSTCPIVGR